MMSKINDDNDDDDD